MPVGKYVPPASASDLRPYAAFEAVDTSEILRLPATLYCAGDIELLLAPKRVAVIGTRTPSEEGVRRTRKLARELVAAGVVVVSGLAKGVDHAAHLSVIENRGKTLAVIGTPLDRAYPAKHADLQMQIYREHLLVSQFPCGTRVFQSNFLQRNRTMARIAHVSVIVEAGETSGSHSEARETIALGRPLFLLRSVVENKSLKWPAGFLAKGARVLDRTEQILEAL